LPVSLFRSTMGHPSEPSPTHAAGMRLVRRSQPEVSNRGARRFCAGAGVTNCETASILLNTNDLFKETSRLWQRGRFLRNTDVKCFVRFVLTLFCRGNISWSSRYVRFVPDFFSTQMKFRRTAFRSMPRRIAGNALMCCPRFKKLPQPDSPNPHSVCSRRLELTEKIGPERRSCGYDCAISLKNSQG